MPKQMMSARVNDLTRQQLDELCKLLNETQAGVLALAIDRMYRDEVNNNLQERNE